MRTLVLDVDESACAVASFIIKRTTESLDVLVVETAKTARALPRTYEVNSRSLPLFATMSQRPRRIAGRTYKLGRSVPEFDWRVKSGFVGSNLRRKNSLASRVPAFVANKFVENMPVGWNDGLGIVDQIMAKFEALE